MARGFLSFSKTKHENKGMTNTKDGYEIENDG